MAMVRLDDETRDKLREYKSKHGYTYTEAVERLLAQADE